MDKSEEVVKNWLKHMDFQDVIHEPDGNVAPDFLVNNRIAVEVRRLNKNHDYGNEKINGLENLSIRLWQGIEKLGHSFGKALDESWFLYVHFARPVRPWKKLRKDLNEALKSFKNQSIRNNGVIYEGKNFELRVLRAVQPLSYFFNLGWMKDRQNGGSLVADVLDNINYCSREKRQKTSKARAQYPGRKWWLVLTYCFLFDLYEDEVQILRNNFQRDETWEKIIVVNLNDHEKWFEL